MGNKIWLIAAISLILVGGIIFGGAMTALNWDFTKLSTVKYETNEHPVTGEYTNISITTDTADVTFAVTDGAGTTVVCYEQETAKHSVTLKDGTLEIEVADTRKWYEHIGITFGTPKITVYIPQGEYGVLSIRSSTGDVKIPKDFKFESIDISESTGDVINYACATETIKIKTNTGSICVEGISAEALDLSVATGRVTVSDVTCAGDINIHVSTGKTNITGIRCKNLSSNGNTGSMSLKNVIATEKLFIERTTGDVTFNGCDAAEILVKTDTGDVTGSLLSEKIFAAKTDTGNVDVPKTAAGGICEISTDTGDIKITVS